MRFRWSVSFEHDTKPVQTVRGEIDRDDAEDAFKSAVRSAFIQQKKPTSFRSWVCVIERLEVDANEN